MSGRGKVVSVIALLVLLSSAPSAAFTPKTRAEITRRAILLMPDALERQLRRHAELLYRAALQRPAETAPPGAAPLDVDRAAGALETAVERAVAALDHQRPMSALVTQLGRAARQVQDLSLATHLPPFDDRHEAFHSDYALYVEDRLPRIRFVFRGFGDPALADGDVQAFARRLARDSRHDYPAVVRSYFPEGREATAQDFDDRSVAFAVASLSVSRAITATARVWLLAWHRAHGDLTGAARLAHGRTSTPFSAPSQNHGADAPAPSEETSP
jgi:hypothetical protein